MHPANTGKQNAELTELLLKIDAYYYKAIRRPSRARSKLAEGLGEIYWKANNYRYRDVISAVRLAARSFRRAAEAASIEEAMQAFSVRMPDIPDWKTVAVAGSDGVARGLPPGAVVLAPSRPRASRRTDAPLFAAMA